MVFDNRFEESLRIVIPRAAKLRSPTCMLGLFGSRMQFESPKRKKSSSHSYCSRAGFLEGEMCRFPHTFSAMRSAKEVLQQNSVLHVTIKKLLRRILIFFKSRFDFERVFCKKLGLQGSSNQGSILIRGQ